jgi:hypothetical protein
VFPEVLMRLPLGVRLLAATALAGAVLAGCSFPTTPTDSPTVDSVVPSLPSVPSTFAVPPTTDAPIVLTTDAPAPPLAQPPAAQPPAVPAPVDCGGDYYVNVDGNCVHRPEQAATAPAGATARCADGTYSFSQHRSGTCSYHGGVAEWLT